jgi:hypothetical protein
MLEGGVGSTGNITPLVISGDVADVADVAEVISTVAKDPFFRIFLSFSLK